MVSTLSPASRFSAAATVAQKASRHSLSKSGMWRDLRASTRDVFGSSSLQVAQGASNTFSCSMDGRFVTIQSHRLVAGSSESYVALAICEVRVSGYVRDGHFLISQTTGATEICPRVLLPRGQQACLSYRALW